MVLLKTTLIGAILLVAGILLLTVVGQYITVEVQVVQRQDVEAQAEFLVGDVTYRNYSLPSGVSVFGTLDVTQAPTNSSSDIQFLVFDSTNYQNWAAGQQSSFIFSGDEHGHSNFTFNTNHSGVYYFVFDDRASLFKKFVTLSVSYNEVTTSRQPDPRVPYFGWGLNAVGLILLVYGLVRKPAIPWA
jgi:hypothetical protein